MKIEKLFLWLATIMIGISVFVMPVTEVPDEVTHADIAWHIFYPDSDHILEWEAQNDRINNPQPADADVNAQAYKDFFTNRLDLSQLEFRLNLHIKDIDYLPQAIGMFLGKLLYPSLGVILTVGRIINALVYILAIYFLIKYLSHGKMILFFVSLLPMMIQQAGSLSYDVLNFVAVAGFFTFIINLADKKKFGNRQLLELLFLLPLLGLIKANNLFLLPLLFMVDFQLTGLLSGLNPVWTFLQKHRYKVLGLGFLLASLVGLIYIQQSVGIVHFTSVLLNTLFNNNLNGALNTFLTVGIFGYFGWLTIQLPLWLVFIDIVVLTILYFSDGTGKIPKRLGLSSGMVFPLQVIIIIAIMYFLWTPRILGEQANISVGSQGRYFTPFLLYFYPLCVSYKDQFKIEAKAATLNRFAVSILILNYIVYLALLLIFYWV